MTVTPSTMRPALAGKILIAVCVLVFVGSISFVTGLRKGCETGFAAASKVLYAESEGGSVKPEAYLKAVDWLATRKRSLGTAESVTVKQTYSGMVGLPCSIELKVLRGGREYLETVQFDGADLEAIRISGR